MRRKIGLLALLSFLASLAAYATTLPGTSAPLSAQDSAIAVRQIVSPQELMTAASSAEKLDGFFQSMSSGSSGQLPLTIWHCNVSCEICSGTSPCPRGDGICTLGPCL